MTANRTAKLMAATSVLGLALGMTAQAADTNQLKTTTGVSDQHKLATGFLKHNTALKCDAASLKLASDQIKYDCSQIKGSSNYHKLPTVIQGKHSVPSSELNPQPEPPIPPHPIDEQKPH